MNCTQALEQMLDADLDAPRTEQDRALAAHVAGCGRCARAATTLRSGMVALAQAVANDRVAAVRSAPAARGIGWFAPRFALAGAALVVVSFVVSRTISTERPLPAPSATPDEVVLPDPAPAATQGTVPPRTTNVVAVVPSVAPAPRVAAVTPERVEPKFFASEPVRVAAVEATPFELTNSANALPVTPENRADAAKAPEISVINRLGTHAMVSRTADPNIVVVWLSPEPNRRNP